MLSVSALLVVSVFEVSKLRRSTFMIQRNLLLAVLFGAVTALPVSAVPITFNLRDTGATAEIELGVITRGGVVATLQPIVTGGGVLNQTTSGFGINATSSTPSADVSDFLDGGAGAESLSITFSTNVFFSGLSLSSFSGTETASLKIGGFAPLTLTETGSAVDVFAFGANNSVAAGQTVVLTYGSGNGFSFDSFTIETASSNSAVPEGSPGLVGLACMLGILVVARRCMTADSALP